MSDSNGQFIERLHNALKNAFDENTLTQMVRFKLNEKLANFASGDFDKITYDLIKWAEQNGRLPELIVYASAYKPSNPLLRKVAWEFVESRINALNKDETAKIFPLIKKIKEYFSAEGSTPGFYLVLTEIIPEMESELNKGMELSKVIESAISEKYNPQIWEYGGVYKAIKGDLDVFLKKLQKEIDPLQTDKVIPIIMMVMTSEQAKELESGKLFNDFSEKVHEDFNKLRDELVNNGAHDWLDHYGETIEEWRPFKHTTDTIKNVILKEINDLFPYNPEIKPKFYDVESLNDPQNRDALEGLRSGHCIVIIDVVSMCHPWLHSKFHESVLDVYKNTYVISIAPTYSAFEKLKEISLVIHMNITNMEFTKRKFDRAKHPGSEIQGDCEDLYDGMRFGQWFEKYVKRIAGEDGIKHQFNKF